MKWVNKLHEFDKIAKQYHDEGFHAKEFFIFGAGESGKIFFERIKKLCKIKGFIDNDKAKQGLIFCGCPIISFEQYMTTKKDVGFIIICLKKAYCESVKKQLDDSKLVEKVMYLEKERFLLKLQISLFYEQNLVYMSLAQISLTERCTLKCKKCAHACNFVSAKAKDLTLDEAKYSADCFFRCVDYIDEFVLIGGEPLLYKDLDKVIDYIGNRYRDQIRIFSITTNGTIMPDERIFKLCRKYNVVFRVSNYSETLPWIEDKINNLKEKAKNAKVICYIGKMKWTDYGFEYVNRGGYKKELERVFDECQTPCHEVRKNRFYYCVMARSVSENMKIGVGEEDYLDISKIDTPMKKKEFFEYSMGYSEKGYLDMCNYCHGADKVNYPIVAAEQMSNNA